MSKRGEIWVWIVVFTLASVWLIVRVTDPTDLSRWTRSGMRFHIDHGTGCHYLGGLTGPPTPRLDSNGQHICTGVRE